MPTLGTMIDYTYPAGVDNYVGYGAISLGDIIQSPDAASRQIVSNVRNNAIPFTVSVTVFEFGQRAMRRLLRRPINKVNSLVFTGKNAPLRGLGVRI